MSLPFRFERKIRPLQNLIMALLKVEKPSPRLTTKFLLKVLNQSAGACASAARFSTTLKGNTERD